MRIIQEIFFVTAERDDGILDTAAVSCDDPKDFKIPTRR
jgi:hypothetical protein